MKNMVVIGIIWFYEKYPVEIIKKQPVEVYERVRRRLLELYVNGEGDIVKKIIIEEGVMDEEAYRKLAEEYEWCQGTWWNCNWEPTIEEEVIMDGWRLESRLQRLEEVFGDLGKYIDEPMNNSGYSFFKEVKKFIEAINDKWDATLTFRNVDEEMELLYAEIKPFIEYFKGLTIEEIQEKHGMVIKALGMSVCDVLEYMGVVEEFYREYRKNTFNKLYYVSWEADHARDQEKQEEWKRKLIERATRVESEAVRGWAMSVIEYNLS